MSECRLEWWKLTNRVRFSFRGKRLLKSRVHWNFRWLKRRNVNDENRWMCVGTANVG